MQEHPHNTLQSTIDVEVIVILIASLLQHRREGTAVDDLNMSEHDDDESDSDEEKDILNLDEATAKLYSHFPPQSAVTKNSQLQTEERRKKDSIMKRLRANEASKLRYYFCHCHVFE